MSRARRMVWPLLGIGLLAGAVVYIGAVDPNKPGNYPLCPLKAMLGIDCFACGGLRAVHDLATGDLVGAADNNLLFVILLPLILALLGYLLWSRWTGRAWATQARRNRVGRVLLITGGTLLLVFMAVRNVPAVPYVGAGIG